VYGSPNQKWTRSTNITMRQIATKPDFRAMAAIETHVICLVIERRAEGTAVNILFLGF